MEGNEETAAKNQKRSLREWIEEHPKTVFWTRLVAWFAFSAALPFAFIAWRYEIFSKSTKISLTGWGMIAVIIVIAFGITLLKYIYKGLKPGLLKQCIFGATAIILPLVILYALINSIEGSIKLFKQALGCTILCEAIGIPINPLPAWLEKRREEQGIEKAEGLSDIFWDKFFKKKKEEEGE